MNKFIIAALALFMATPVLAQNYVGAGAGMTFNKTSDIGSGTLDTDDGFVGSVVAGRKFGNWRTETEVSYSQADNNKYMGRDVNGDVSLTAITVNEIYTYPVTESLGLFAGVGLGMGKLDVSNGWLNDDSSVAIGKAKSGVSYQFTDNVFMDVGYQYMTAVGGSVGGDNMNFDSSSVNTAVYFQF